MRKEWWKTSAKQVLQVEKLEITSVEQVINEAALPFGTGVSSSPASWIAGLQAARAATEKIRGKIPKLAFLFATEEYDPRPLLQGVKFVTGNIPLIGSFTHGIVFTEETALQNGVALGIFATNDSEFSLGVGEHPKKNLAQAVENALAHVAMRHESLKNRGFTKLSLFVLTDSELDAENLLDELHTRVGDDVPIAGAIMSNSGFEKGGLFWRHEILSDVLIMIGIHSKNFVEIGIAHGFHPTIPFRVTKARGNLIKELDDKNAFDLLKEIFLKKGLSETDLEKPGLIFSRFQFGIPDPRKPGYSWIRMPITVLEDGSIKISGKVEEGTTIWLMEAREESLLKAPKKAFDMAAESDTWGNVCGGIVLEGISRATALGKAYPRELEALRKRMGIPILAASSFAEFVFPRSGVHGVSNSSILMLLLQGQ